MLPGIALNFKGPVTLSRIPQATVLYMETDTDEGGSCKRFTDLPLIRYGSPAEHYGDPRALSVSIRLDPVMFWLIFVGTEVSRMKGMPQGHPGWVYGQ